SHFVLYLLPSPSSLFPYTTLFRSFTVPLLPLPVRGELRLWETQVTVDFVSCNFVGHFVVFSALDAGIVIDKVLGIVRWLSIWAVNRNCSKRFTKDVIFAQVVDGFHQGVRQHLNPSARNLVLWSNVKVHVVWLTRLEFAVNTIHARSQCSGKAKVRTASEVRCTDIDS